MIKELLVAASILVCLHGADGCMGCIGLSEITFDKVIPRFPAVLVKFDVAFPYGDKHEIFAKLAKETEQSKELVLAEVGVKDYGEKDNEQLAKKYGVGKDDYPAVKLFRGGLDTPVDFPKSTEFTLDNLRSFVRDNTDIYLGLPGCLESYDRLAKEFIAATNKVTVLKKAEELTATLSEKDASFAKTYMVIMRKVVESGAQFIDTESQRVRKLLKSKLTDKKHQEIRHKLNVLRAFSSPSRDEL